MRTLLTILVLVAAIAPAGAVGNTSVQILDSNNENYFVFKVHPALKGAKIEVFHASGDLLLTETLSKRKMIIDFRSVKEGTYRIHVEKGNESEVFEYIKK